MRRKFGKLINEIAKKDDKNNSPPILGISPS